MRMEASPNAQAISEEPITCIVVQEDKYQNIQQTAGDHVQKAIRSKPQQQERPQQRERTGPGFRSAVTVGRRSQTVARKRGRMGHELKNDCKKQAEALIHDTSDNPEQHFTPPIAPSKRRSTRALRKVQYHDGGGNAWQRIRGGAARDSRRHRFGYRLLLYVRTGEHRGEDHRGGPTESHDARIRRLHRQRAVDRECQGYPEEPRQRHPDGNHEMNWKYRGSQMTAKSRRNPCGERDDDTPSMS